MSGGDVKLSGSLSEQSYRPLREGEVFEPVVAADKDLPELTTRAVLTGIIIGVVFGFANAYLGLKAGLTISASIPAAVIGILAYRFMGKQGSLLETNIVQTIGSAGESLAAGVIFSLPVLILWDLPVSFWPIFPLSLFGGLLGVLFMIPLRKYLIEEEHGKLLYPEGVACAEVQVASQGEGSQGRYLLMGGLVGFFYTALEKLGLYSGEPDFPIALPEYRTSFGGTFTPELLGVGFIIGPQVSAVMLAGGLLGWLVIIPAIFYFGGTAPEPLLPATMLISEMNSFDVWENYLRYIGAGAVAFGGLATLVKSLPTILNSFGSTLSSWDNQDESESQVVPRTSRELSSKVVLGLLAVITLGLCFLPLMAGHNKSIGLLAAIAIVLLSFFFVTVSSRIVGLIGSSSNPISGMTIGTVMLCAYLFSDYYAADEVKIAVLTVGSLICIAAAIAGDTSQDLKSGFLVGATPRNQQIAELVGVTCAAITMTTVLTLFKEDILSGALRAPQANLIKLIIEGVVDGNLPWGLILLGVGIGMLVELTGLPTLAFAVGLYLPVHLGVPVMVGGLIRYAIDAIPEEQQQEVAREQGILTSSGMIAGAAFMGIAAGLATYFNIDLKVFEFTQTSMDRAAVFLFVVLSLWLYFFITRFDSKEE